jgi:hypothetical protein
MLARRPSLLSSAEESIDQFVSGQPDMTAHVGEYRRQRSHSERTVTWDRHVMFALLNGSQAQVAASLTGDEVAEGPKRVSEVTPRDIPGKPHTAMVSSLTK